MIMSVFRPSHWMSTLALVTLQAPVVVTQSALLLPVEAEPLQLPSDVAAVKRTVTQLLLRWTPTSCLRARQGASSSTLDSKGLNLLFKLWQGSPIPNLQQVVGRLASCWHGVKMSMLLIVCAFSAILTSLLLSYLKTNSTGSLNDAIFGGILAITFCSTALARKQDVLQYPDTSQAYLPRLLSCLPSVIQEASTVTASAFLFKLVAYMLLHIAAGLPPALSVRAGTATQLIAGSFCAFSWSAGAFLVQIVYSHRVKQFQEDSGGDPSALLIPVLLDTKDPLMQNAAFQDLCFLAEASGPAAWRRKMVFHKDNGETWQQLSTVCVDEVHHMISTAAGILPQTQGQAQLTDSQQATAAPTAAPAQWNAPVNTKKALILSAAQPSELRAWRLHSHRNRITWSIRTLAAFAAAAATEDRKGVLHSPSQPDCPDLATIIALLLSAKQVLQDFVTQVASSPLQMQKGGGVSKAYQPNSSSTAQDDSQHPVFRSAALLQQANSSAINKIVAAYGQDFVAILNKIAYQPSYGSKPLLQNLAVQCFQDYQERQKQNAK
ncbi:hypothetical protein WJX77_009031 [Trebouxia sp. C0004]